MTVAELQVQQAETLREALRRTQALSCAGLRPVLLFDLDDTVLSTTRRHVRILQEFSAAYASRWPDAAARLAALIPAPFAYCVTDIAHGAGVEQAEVLKALRGFWFERFFRSEYVLEDAPVPGAPEFCQKAVAAGGYVVYLTGRDETMRPGTEISLAEKGFPLPAQGQAKLVCKPSFDSPDLEFKNEVLERIAQWGPVAAGFENEPAHINLFREKFPEGLMVLVETKHSGKPVTPHPDVLRIRDFVLPG